MQFWSLCYCFGSNSGALVLLAALAQIKPLWELPCGTVQRRCKGAQTRSELCWLLENDCYLCYCSVGTLLWISFGHWWPLGRISLRAHIYRTLTFYFLLHYPQAFYIASIWAVCHVFISMPAEAQMQPHSTVGMDAKALSCVLTPEYFLSYEWVMMMKCCVWIKTRHVAGLAGRPSKGIRASL